jgi:Diacylglycerol acyltransferase
MVLPNMFLLFLILTDYYHQIGAPLIVTKKPKSEITQQDVDTLHKTFCDAMTNLFEKTKSRHGCSPDQKLVIV